jgi:hypothetical protein
LLTKALFGQDKLEKVCPASSDRNPTLSGIRAIRDTWMYRLRAIGAFFPAAIRGAVLTFFSPIPTFVFKPPKRSAIGIAKNSSSQGFHQQP